MVNLKYILVLWFFGAALRTDGQDNDCCAGATAGCYAAGVTLHGGFLINHHRNMRILNEKRPYAAEVYVGRLTGGEGTWHSFYNNPMVGVSYTLLDTGSPSFVGKAHCVYPFMRFLLTGAERRVNLNMRMGVGVAYVEKVFDPVSNFKNVAIGSHLNALLSFGMGVSLRISAPVMLSAGLGYTHVSNGNFERPNTGLNYVTAFAGAGYVFAGSGRHTGGTVAEATDAWRGRDGWRYAVYVSGGVKSYTTFDDSKFAAMCMSLEASRKHLEFTRFNFALDVFYDTSDYAYLVMEGEENVRRVQTVKPGVAAGYDFLFGRVGATVQAGCYFYARNRQYGMVYQRLALCYAATGRVMARICLKTHWAQADYVELGIGYTLL